MRFSHYRLSNTVGDIGDATAVADEGLTTVAPNAEVLSEQGAAPAKTLRADEFAT